MCSFDYVLEAVITYTTELAMEQAQAADKLFSGGTYLGPLHGIPYGLKDIMAVKGYPTTWGAPQFRNQYINADCNVYKRCYRVQIDPASMAFSLSRPALPSLHSCRSVHSSDLRQNIALKVNKGTIKIFRPQTQASKICTVAGFRVLCVTTQTCCRLTAAGAVLIAKLVTGEMAYDDVWFGGRTKNPWNIMEGSSGSSAGAPSIVSVLCCTSNIHGPEGLPLVKQK